MPSLNVLMSSPHPGPYLRQELLYEDVITDEKLIVYYKLKNCFNTSLNKLNNVHENSFNNSFHLIKSIFTTKLVLNKMDLNINISSNNARE